jgi:branched-chain amino acid aminotransferase
MGLRADNLKTHVMVASWAWPSYMDPEARDRGIRIATSSYTRHHVNITMCKAKANGNYINSILALREAMDAGFEEALLLDNEGYVAEGSGENFFLVRDGVLYTPELTSCLEGITRDSILRIAADQGLTVKEKRITRDEVYVADEAFFTGTAAEVVPIRELDNRMIGSGTRGPITEKLQSIYFEAVRGEQSQYAGGWPQWPTRLALVHGKPPRRHPVSTLARRRRQGLRAARPWSCRAHRSLRAPCCALQ